MRNEVQKAEKSASLIRKLITEHDYFGHFYRTKRLSLENLDIPLVSHQESFYPILSVCKMLISSHEGCTGIFRIVHFLVVHRKQCGNGKRMN